MLARGPWVRDAVALLKRCRTGVGRGVRRQPRCQHTALHRGRARARDRHVATAAISDLLRLLAVVPLETADFQHALVLGLADYENTVQAAASLKVGADDVVARNAQDYRGVPGTPRSAGEVLALL